MPTLNGDQQDLLYPRVAAYFYGTPWALLPEKLAVLQSLLHFRAQGGRLSQEEIRANIGARHACDDCGPSIGAARQSSSYRAQSSVAILPLYGVISQRADLFGDSSGGTSVEGMTKRLRQAMADPEIGGIVLDVDSPGGSVFGIEELANEIAASNKAKPIVAVANSSAASAAYWLASAAGELSVTPSGEVGSIGVFTAHDDLSKMLDMMGVKTTLISAGKYKTEANPYEPLGDEARAALQARVDDYYQVFTRAVAKGRNTSVEAVRSGFGEGRMVGAQDAVKAGMADRVETLDQAVSRLQSQLASGQPKGKAAADDSTRVLAVESVEWDAKGTEAQVLVQLQEQDAPDPTSDVELRLRRLRLAGRTR